MTDSVYRERAHLVAHLAARYPSTIGLTDPSAPDWAVVTIETPAGQMCWHIATDDYDLFEHVERSLDARWDGHTTEEKYERLRALTTLEGGQRCPLASSPCRNVAELRMEGSDA